MKRSYTYILGSLLLSSFAITSTSYAADPYFPSNESGFQDSSYGGRSGWYIRGDIGMAFSDFLSDVTDDLADDGSAFSFGAGIGHRFNDNFRMDFTVDHSGNFKDNGGKIDATTAMINGYVDIPVNEAPITPYVGMGLGLGMVDADISKFSEKVSNNTKLAISGMAGLTFNVTEMIDVDAGYKYRRIYFDGKDFSDHLVRAGLRLNF